MNITLGKYIVSISFRARRQWNDIQLFKTENSRHLVWGRLSLQIEDWTAEVYRVCTECGSPDIGEVSYGDEGLTICQSCRTVEGGYKYVNLRDYENAT